jgi:general secretion pathway protein C
MMARLSAFVIWALVAVGMVFWGMRLLVRPDPAPSNAIVVSDAAGARGDLAQLLGAEAVAAVALPPAMSTRFKLIGVMAARTTPDRAATPGIALISIDGKPPRPYAAGARVDEQLVLQTVGMRSASLGPAQGAAAFVLEVPPLPPPNTGAAPKATMDPLPSASPPAMAPPPAQAAIPVPGAEASPAQPPAGASSPRMPRRARPGMSDNATR